MNRAFTFAAISLTLFAVGCGGSSVQTPASTPSVATLSTPQIEAVLLQAGNAADPYAPVVEDTQNIEVQDLVEFQVVAYDSAGGRHVLPATNWRWDDKTDQFGKLDPYSGLFTVGTSAMSTHFKVNATVISTGVTVGQYYLVNPNQARIIGKVVGSDTNAGLRGITIDFFDSSGNETTAVTTSYDGTFRASSKLTAVQFTIDPDSIASTYWQQYAYGANPTPPPPNNLYDAGSNTCWSPFQMLYSRNGVQLGTALTIGENFLFAPAQPSVLLEPVSPASSTDPNLIVVSAKSTYQTRPTSTGCTG